MKIFFNVSEEAAVYRCFSKYVFLKQILLSSKLNKNQLWSNFINEMIACPEGHFIVTPSLHPLLIRPPPPISLIIKHGRMLIKPLHANV